jgi:hypothetical protein
MMAVVYAQRVVAAPILLFYNHPSAAGLLTVAHDQTAKAWEKKHFGNRLMAVLADH